MTRRYLAILCLDSRCYASPPPPPHEVNKISSGYTLYRIRTTTSTAQAVIQRRVEAPGTWHYIGLTRRTLKIASRGTR